jgi:acyl-CoA thioesterase FadM
MLPKIQEGSQQEWHVYEMIVSWHESDPAGIAFHGNYVFWLERAFMSLLYSRGYELETRGVIQNVGFPVTLLTCRYLKPIPVWSRLKVCMTVSPDSHLRKLIIPFKILLSKADEIAAEGEIHRRFVEMGLFQMTECPNELRQVFGFHSS